MSSRLAALLAALSVVALLASCATLVPGADPVVVRTEQFLEVSGGAWTSLMRWYWTPGVVASLSDSQTRVMGKVRAGFEEPYKRTQSALDRYKATRAPGIRAEMTALRALLLEAADVVIAHGGAAPKVPDIPAEVP